MLAPQVFDGEAKLGNGAGLQVLHEHIGAPQHRGKERLIGRLGEIEHHGFLAAVEPDEIAALAERQVVIAAREIAVRPLDLDHPRAGIGEPAAAHRRRHRLFERHHEEAGEGKSHRFHSYPGHGAL